ncbi:MAG: hypothetical protein AAF386_02585 [Pseudomonadota bacterium]
MARSRPLELTAHTIVPDCHKGKLARQVRQDVWRALQNLRGFVPVVTVTNAAQGLKVTARGMPCQANAKAQADLEAVLSDPKNHMRWVNYARAGQSK